MRCGRGWAFPSTVCPLKCRCSFQFCSATLAPLPSHGGAARAEWGTQSPLHLDFTRPRCLVEKPLGAERGAQRLFGANCPLENVAASAWELAVQTLPSLARFFPVAAVTSQNDSRNARHFAPRPPEQPGLREQSAGPCRSPALCPAAAPSSPAPQGDTGWHFPRWIGSGSFDGAFHPEPPAFLSCDVCWARNPPAQLVEPVKMAPSSC